MPLDSPIPKLGVIADRIDAHLKRIEAAPQYSVTRLYFHAQSWTAGSRVGIRYVSYQGNWFLAKADALKYLAWLDAGNSGRHFTVLPGGGKCR